jgi:hypothetical protein
MRGYNNPASAAWAKPFTRRVFGDILTHMDDNRLSLAGPTIRTSNFKSMTYIDRTINLESSHKPSNVH